MIKIMAFSLVNGMEKLGMIRTYFKVALRHFLKEKFFSLINITGLAIGISVALLIAIYVLHELQYDRFHAKSDRIYRIASFIEMGGNATNLNSTFPPFAAALEQDVPEVEEAVRLYTLNDKVFKYENKVFTEDEIYYADPDFFNVFTFTLLAGDKTTALQKPYQILLTPTLVKKYLDTDDWQSVPGKSIYIDGELHEITGVIEEAPELSHFKYAAMASMESTSVGRDREWNSMNVSTYVLLHENATIQGVTEKIPGVMSKNMENYDKLPQAGVTIRPFAQALTDIHLYSNIQGEFEPTGNITTIYIFVVIAGIVLLLACVNFVNLTTARSANRAKEVGVRKVLGSATRQLMRQFTLESIMTVVFATLLALGMVELMRYPFNAITGKQLSFEVLLNPIYLVVLILFVMGLGGLAGLYPSFFLASFKPAQVLKGKLRSGFRSSRLRNSLVTVQFVISIVLITCTLIVQRQLSFMRAKKLGFDKENVVVIDNADRLQSQQAFINSLKSFPGVQDAASSMFRPIGDYDGTTISTEDDKENRKLVNFSYVDYEFINTLRFELTQGRNFSRDLSSDSTAVILNETAARFLFTGNPVNKKMYTEKTFTVIGVVKDFNFESLKNEVRPLAFFLGPDQRFLNVRLNPGDHAATLAAIEKQWKQQNADVPFTYAFLDETYNDLFKEEGKLSTLFSSFTVLALFIACLGLLGLAAYMAEQRSKEISVRKVLGATASQIVVLLSKDFVRIILVAFAVAAPAAYFIMKKWLAGFAYQTELSMGLLLVGGLLVMATALLAVSYQAIRAALVNPVKSLKEE